jgi:hypothetical protein
MNILLIEFLDMSWLSCFLELAVLVDIMLTGAQGQLAAFPVLIE